MRNYSRKTALIAAGIMALSPWSGIYATEADNTSSVLAERGGGGHGGGGYHGGGESRGGEGRSHGEEHHDYSHENRGDYNRNNYNHNDNRNDFNRDNWDRNNWEGAGLGGVGFDAVPAGEYVYPTIPVPPTTGDMDTLYDSENNNSSSGQ